MNADCGQEKEQKGFLSFLQNIGTASAKASERWIPDALVIAFILSVIAFAATLKWGGVGPLGAVKAWGDGFWSLLELAMQFAFAIVCANSVAVSKPAGKLLNFLGGLPNPDKPWQAIALMTTFSLATAWVNWAFTIVVSATLVPYIVINNPKADFRLLVTAAYVGMGTIWHTGLSGTAPLVAATEGNFLITGGILDSTISTASTIFSSWNFMALGIVCLFLVVFCVLLTPKGENAYLLSKEKAQELLDFRYPEKGTNLTPAQRVTWWRGWNLIFGALGVAYLVQHFLGAGLAAWTINTYNFVFLTMALLLHESPASFIKSVQESVGKAWGVIIQFPFYAGMFGLMVYTQLGTTLTHFFVSLTNQNTFLLITYWWSNLLNYFIPSGGAKWAIEAPWLIEAGKQLGVSPAATTLAYSWGDTTNLIQPFWALALLGIVKIDFREIIGYCALIFLACFTVISLLIYFTNPIGL